jgi:hypothetical protein
MGFLSAVASLLLMVIWAGWWWLHLDRAVIGALCAAIVAACWLCGRGITTYQEHRRGNRQLG